nr:hypothetical protein GCM10020185_88120 [Pseudomonas brassicacearum subsp. brassicacearum]
MARLSAKNSRQVTYGQRSRDDRLVFGARGGYRFGGRLRSDFNLSQAERELRQYLFSELFPMLRNVRLTHAWGGNLGVARHFSPAHAGRPSPEDRTRRWLWR